MIRRNRGFTLPEVLVVIGILAALSALLFPVLLSAKASAHRTFCASNFRMAHISTYLYIGDYDDRFMPVNHLPGSEPNPKIDRTWVQLLLPYMRDFAVFECPSDYGRTRGAAGVFDGDLVPGDTYSRYYFESLRVNVGYNYLYYSPVVWANGAWKLITRSAAEIGDLSRALLYVDSVYAMDANGRPTGGGSYVVIPPCRYSRDGVRRIDSFGLDPGAQVFTASKGWRFDTKSAFRFGLAYPWHDGRMNIVRAAGGTIPVTPTQLAAGCDVRENWEGFIQDGETYPWDLN